MTSNWKKYKLQDLTLKQNQGVNTTTEKVKYCENGTHKVVRAKNILPYKLLLDDVVYIDDNTFKKINDNCKPQKNDILYTNIGSQLGNASLVTTNEDFIIAWNVLRLQIDQTKILPSYCLYLLNSNENKQKIVSLNSSSTMPFVSGTELSKVEFTIPPLETQQKIAKVLSAIDDKIELNNSINNNLEQQVQAIFKSWFVDFEPFGGTMPNDWEIKTLDEFCNIFTGRKNANENDENGKNKFFTCGPKPLLINSYIHDGPAIIIAGNGAYTGRTRFYDGKFDLYQRTYACISLENINKDYIYLLYIIIKNVLQKNIMGGTHGSAVPYIVMNDIAKFEITFKKDIFDNLSSIIKPFINKILENEIENEKLIQLRDTLLPKLMSGEIDVSNVDISTDKLSFSEDK